MTIESIINHLWQSSCFALLAGICAFVLRRNSPKLRYWVWLSASLKFLLPWVLLVSLGSLVPWPRHRVAFVATSAVSGVLVRIAEPFSVNSYAVAPARVQTHWGVTAVVFLWAAGFVAIGFRIFRSSRSVWAMLRRAYPVQVPVGVPAVIAPSADAPGIVGFLRPVLVLPPRLLERLNPKQLEALLAHELSHVRRRDNFFAALHMGVEAIFWFHPLVWWIGSRMLEERELACDEEVLRQGYEPTDYARGILTVCEHYSEAPLPCISGVTGADIRKRLKIILRGTPPCELSGPRKLAMAFAAAAALAGPVGFGMWNAPAAQAQSVAQRGSVMPQWIAFAQQSQRSFEVASVKPANTDDQRTSIQIEPGGRFVASATLKALIGFAYDVQDHDILGGPGWIDSDLYRIDAKIGITLPQPAEPALREMLQSLLADRFKLSIHRESRDEAVYELVPVKAGARLKKAATPGPPSLSNGRGRIGGKAADTEMLARMLSGRVGRVVINKTGLKGSYDFDLNWVPVPGERDDGAIAGKLADPEGPTLFTALQEQLGLRLQSARGPVETLVIDRAQKPDAN